MYQLRNMGIFGYHFAKRPQMNGQVCIHLENILTQ